MSKGKYFCVKEANGSVYAFTDDKDLMMKFLSIHRHINELKKLTVEKISKKKFYELLSENEDKYLCEFGNFAIRTVDAPYFTNNVVEAKTELGDLLRGLSDFLEWDLRPKEVKKIENALKVIWKYFDDEAALIEARELEEMSGETTILDLIRDMKGERFY